MNKTKEALERLLKTLESGAAQARAIAQNSPTNIHRSLEEPIRECRGKLQRIEYAEERAKARVAAEKSQVASGEGRGASESPSAPPAKLAEARTPSGGEKPK